MMTMIRRRGRISTAALLAAVVGAGALTTGLAPLSSGDPKARTLEEMIALARQISDLKGGSDPSAAASFASLLERYERLSKSLGGDDPAGMLGGSAAGAAGGGPQGGIAGVEPPPPPGCTATEFLYSNTDVVAIPSGPAVVTSMMVVAGAGSYLWDLNLTLDITHTFGGDLDVTLASPGGTIVTVTTDNGAGNDNVYNGTLFNDDADADGQVPYTNNDGLVTDSLYANLVVETPLVVEEALAALLGEDPNGTWTLTISDDAGGDMGNLNSWSLAITTLDAEPSSTTSSFTNSTPVMIPSTAPPIVLTSTIDVSGLDEFLCDVNLMTNLTHTFGGDIDMTLQSPAGTVVTVTTDNAGANDDTYNGTVWDDDADADGQVPYVNNDGLATDSLYANLVVETPLVPEEAFGAFIGENPNGTWTLTISDDANLDGGTLSSWTIDLTTCACKEEPCPGDTNGDGLVNVQDLSNVITSWGTDGQGQGFDADVNNDGIVNVQDLTAVITGWGFCNPIVSFSVPIEATQEVPNCAGAGALAGGTGDVELNKATLELSWSITFSGLSGPATLAHFHGPAAPGVNAGVQVDIGAISGLISPMVGMTTVTAAQAGQIQDGLWYINIHTAACPGGEIRGQVQ